MEVPVHQAGHPKEMGTGEDRLRLIGAGILVHNIQNPAVLDGDGFPGDDHHIRGEIAGVGEQQITAETVRHRKTSRFISAA